MEAAAEQKPSPIMRAFNRNEYTWTITLFLLPTIVFMAVFVVWPILSSFNLSFYEWNGIDPVPHGSQLIPVPPRAIPEQCEPWPLSSSGLLSSL